MPKSLWFRVPLILTALGFILSSPEFRRAFFFLLPGLLGSIALGYLVGGLVLLVATGVRRLFRGKQPPKIEDVTW